VGFYNGGSINMMKINLKLPDTFFGIETGLLKIWALPLPLILIFFISLRLVILPKIDDINSINQKIKLVNDQVKEVVSKRSYLMAVDKDELKQNANNMDSALLKDKQSYYLVEVVRTIADKYSYQVKSFSISPGQLKSEDKIKISGTNVLNKVPIDMVIVGPEDKYLDLLLSLENSLPIITINNLNIKTQGGVSEIKTNVTAYYINGKIDSNVGNLSLNDLTLKKEEIDLLNRLTKFENLNKTTVSTNTEVNEQQFTKYQRQNPFSL
jgi:hypothetical protein